MRSDDIRPMPEDYAPEVWLTLKDGNKTGDMSICGRYTPDDEGWAMLRRWREILWRSCELKRLGRRDEIEWEVSVNGSSNAP